MRTAIATYHAPEGDNKVAEMGGVTFFDGQAAELNSNEHGHLMAKLPGNPHFEIEMGEDDGEAGTGSTARDFKAGIEEARDHSFEADQRAAQAARDERALAATPRRGRPPKNPADEPKASE